MRARLSVAAAISLYSPVFMCCFRAILQFVRSAARPSQYIVSMSTAFIYRRHIYIAGEGGRWFSSPKPAPRRGCRLECDHPPYDGHDPPSQSALSKQSVRSGKTSTGQYINVGYFILPAYSQDTADASQVECVEPSLMRDICSPRLAAIQKCADNTGIVDCHLGLHRQLGACPYSSSAFPILLLIAASKESLSVMVEPRKVNWETASSS